VLTSGSHHGTLIAQLFGDGRVFNESGSCSPPRSWPRPRPPRQLPTLPSSFS
jgi:hypothetical protein